MNTAACPTPLRPRPALRDPLQLAVIDNTTGRCVSSFPSWIDVCVEDCPLQFEEEGWSRAVREGHVNPAERHRYSVHLR